MAPKHSQSCRFPTLQCGVGKRVLVFLSAVIYIPFLSGLFHFFRLRPVDAVAGLASGVSDIALIELYKYISKNRL